MYQVRIHGRDGQGVVTAVSQGTSCHDDARLQSPISSHERRHRLYASNRDIADMILLVAASDRR